MKNLLKKYSFLGPGLLYAGAAVGVSHLVQSTQAGAKFGYSLIWAVILVNIFKYPFFEFGPRYAAGTGKSLIDGYKSLGKWAISLFYLLTFSSMFIVIAAVSLVTSGLLNSIGVEFSFLSKSWHLAALLLVACIVFLTIGKFSILDKSMKMIIVVLSITTVIALIGSIFNSPVKQNEYQFVFDFSNSTNIAFLISLMGWMPAPLDIAVWNSIWTVEKNKNIPQKKRLKASLTDFKVGYWGTMILALCFLSLGAQVIYGTGQEFSKSAGVFASQFIEIYAMTLGDWAVLFISVAALTTMLSTTITCLDAYPRVLTSGTSTLFKKIRNLKETDIYLFWIIITAGGAICILAFFKDNMGGLVKFITILSFLTAPFFAVLNFLVINSKDTPKEIKPGRSLNLLAFLGIFFLLGFSAYYLIKLF